MAAKRRARGDCRPPAALGAENTGATREGLT